jgi:hypothetical protein
LVTLRGGASVVEKVASGADWDGRIIKRPQPVKLILRSHFPLYGQNLVRNIVTIARNAYPVGHVRQAVHGEPQLVSGSRFRQPTVVQLCWQPGEMASG